MSLLEPPPRWMVGSAYKQQDPSCKMWKRFGTFGTSTSMTSCWQEHAALQRHLQLALHMRLREDAQSLHAPMCMRECSQVSDIGFHQFKTGINMFSHGKFYAALSSPPWQQPVEFSQRNFSASAVCVTAPPAASWPRAPRCARWPAARAPPAQPMLSGTFLEEVLGFVSSEFRVFLSDDYELGFWSGSESRPPPAPR